MMRTHVAIVPRLITLAALLCSSSAVRPADARAQAGRYYDYSGTIAWQGILRISSPQVQGYDSLIVTATVVKGKVTCAGTWRYRLQHSGQLPVIESGTVSGPGLLDLVPDPDGEAPTSGWYQFSIACPSAATARSPAQPAKLGQGHNAFHIDRHGVPAVRDLALLVGADTIPHPDTDETNGATGTFTTTWRLTTTTAVKPPPTSPVPTGRP